MNPFNNNVREKTVIYTVLTYKRGKSTFINRPYNGLSYLWFARYHYIFAYYFHTCVDM